MMLGDDDDDDDDDDDADDDDEEEDGPGAALEAGEGLGDEGEAASGTPSLADPAAAAAAAAPPMAGSFSPLIDASPSVETSLEAA